MMVISLLAKTTLAFSTALLNPPQSYEIKNLHNTRDLKMGCAGIQKLYLSTNSRRKFDAVECSAFFMKDSYYHEYLIPLSVLQGQKPKRINVCSTNSLLFMSTNNTGTQPKKKKCQNLKIRTRDSQYAYAGYLTPTCRLDGLNKPRCYTSAAND
jgi:hypothetical protein